MIYTISPDGWVSGALTGLSGVEYPLERHECPRPGNEAYRRLEKLPPDLLLHTTEGVDLDSAIATLKAKFSPSQWACGENRIAQLRPLWAQGAAVDEQNAWFMQVETVARSQLTLWLPAPETLNPLVALVAMLHREHIITTGTARPKTLEALPLVLDRLPAAVDTYYRRFLAPEPTHDGVRGHVDVTGDEHYDPGSFDYPRFFTMVEALISGGDEMTPEEKAQLAEALKKAREADEFRDGVNLRRAGKPEPTEAGATKNGWRFADEAFTRPPAGGGNPLKPFEATITPKN